MPEHVCEVADRVRDARWRFDPVVRGVFQRALQRAGDGEHLRVDDVTEALLCLDGGFIVRKLRPWRVDVAAVARTVHEATRMDPTGTDRVGMATVASLLAEVATGCASVGSQQLFVAILLEDQNSLARVLRTAAVDSRRLIRERFSFLAGAVRLLDTGQAPDQVRAAVEPVVAEVLQGLAEGQPRPPQPPCDRVLARRPPPVPIAPQLHEADLRRSTAEATARRWLAKLVPEQAERYAREGFLEVASTRHPGRVYRIRRRCMTEVEQPGESRWESCLHVRDEFVPDTDRVIAEYFLIRGDEARYLRKAIRHAWSGC